MSQQLNETIATVEYENLFYSADVAVTTGGVTIASGQGKLKRGTILAKGEDGKCVILGTTITKDEGSSATTETPVADCILCDDVDATSSDVGAVAYLSGHFNIDALGVKTGYTLKESDKDALRTKNILIGKMLG